MNLTQHRHCHKKRECQIVTACIFIIVIVTAFIPRFSIIPAKGFSYELVENGLIGPCGRDEFNGTRLTAIRSFDLKDQNLLINAGDKIVLLNHRTLDLITVMDEVTFPNGSKQHVTELGQLERIRFDVDGTFYVTSSFPTNNSDLFNINEKISTQPLSYHVNEAKLRMNNLFLHAALAMVVIILLTSIIILTEFTTFVAEEKRVVIHKLVLRGLSLKKHVPWIITIERGVLLIGSVFFGLLFTIGVIIAQEIIGILPLSSLSFSSIITLQQFFDVFNHVTAMKLFVAAILQLFIMILVLHQFSFDALLRKSQFLLGGSDLLSSSTLTNVQPLISTKEGSSTIQKKFSKFQLIIHVIGFILLLILSEFASWIQATTSLPQVAMLKALTLYLGLLLVISVVFAYYPRIIGHVGRKLYLKNKSAFFATRSMLMRMLTEKPPVQFRLLIILTISLTLVALAHLNIQNDQQLALSQSFTNIGADIRISGIDVSNNTIINQIQSIDGVDTVSPLKIARIHPTDGSKTYAFYGLELSSFLSILEQRKSFIDPDILTSVNILKSKTEQLALTSNIDLDDAIPVLFHRQLQEELNIKPGTTFILSVPSYKDVGRQRYDLRLEVIDFFMNFPGITPTPDSLRSTNQVFEIPVILPAPILNALINATSIPTSEQDEYLLLTVTDETRITTVMQELYTLFELNPALSIEKRLTSSELEEVLYQLDVYESIKVNQMQLIAAFIMLIVILASLILHFRQWIKRYEQLALLFGATETTLKREYFLELAFHMMTVTILAALTDMILLVITTGITSISVNDYLQHFLTLLGPISIGSALIMIVTAAFILVHPIKISKATLPRFTN